MNWPERTLYVVVILYIVLAGTWAFAWEILPHRPLHPPPKVRVPGAAYFDDFEMRPVFPTPSQWCLILALSTAGLGLLQMRWLQNIGALPSAGLTIAFLSLMATAALGIWFLSLHRGTLEDRWPDSTVRSLTWFSVKGGFLVAVANMTVAFARRRST
jgi:hypothetical protein